MITSSAQGIKNERMKRILDTERRKTMKFNESFQYNGGNWGKDCKKLGRYGEQSYSKKKKLN